MSKLGTYPQYGTILDLHRNEVSRYELLIRMQGDDGELIPPGSFLPAAERFGLIQSVDAWVIEQAVKLIDEHRCAGSEIFLEVNLSGRSVSDPNLPKVIESALAGSSANPANLVFEITETAAIANMDEARRLAGCLRALGCQFALDDFGAGFGSFYYLKHFPLDYLKIDGEFVRSLERSSVDQRIVRAMLEVARGLSLRTIAEFVETQASLDLLRTFGVNFAQGYHIGRPGPPAEVVNGVSS